MNFENNTEVNSIPIPNNSNYGEWVARMTILLRSKDLLNVCKKPIPSYLSTTATNKWNKSSFDAISIISCQFRNRVFIEVVKQFSKNAHLLWTKLEEKYASKKAVNRGRVWMQWLKFNYDGNLKHDINNSRTLMMALETVNINIPNECHSFSLLGKLYFTSFTQMPEINISTGDLARTLVSVGTGTVVILCGNQTLTLENSLLVPRLNCNIVSLMALSHKKMVIQREGDSFTLKMDEKGSIKGKITNNMMWIEFSIPGIHSTTAPLNLWHERLGHPRNLAIKAMGLPSVNTACSTCNLNKMHILPFKDHFGDVSQPPDCVHLDLVGPISPASISGFRYFLTIVDQATSFNIVCLPKLKSDAFYQFVIVKNLIENLNDQKIKTIVSDHGGEFVNDKFKKLANTNDFIHILSPPETPQHHGFAERANKTIIKKARCILNFSNLPKRYWAEAINTAIFLSNLIPTPSRSNHSPYFIWKGLPPRIRRLPVFGCRAIIPIPRNKAWVVPWDSPLELTEMVDESYQSGHSLAEKFQPNNLCLLEDSSGLVDEAQEFSIDAAAVEDSRPVNHSHIKVIRPRHPTLIEYKQAVNSHNKESWQMAIDKELSLMNWLHVWDIVDLQPDYKLVGTIWAFQIKNDHLNNVTEYKACLCAQGFTQTPGVDFEKTYTPTGRLNSLRCI
ncbi:hypothetical protein O181_041637 [Austropuccinia psidii MF-1]|uniref:Integrase catalytic domain-containing protein n=1 Tax=Austropuccinia psidii MF-1 TaxID=1389203 RepID=A0A9Q3DH34_9BASI|nr:hypothetical protein [Austropuccinia psidii MF-1]